MRYLLAFPLISLALIAYNIMAFTDQNWLWSEAWRVEMMSGALLRLQWADILILVALFLLFCEVLKAARVGSFTIIDHIMSTAVFIVALVEFLLVREAGTAPFFMLMFISLIDVVAGYSISIRSARRDVAFGGSGPA
ncbi:MAG: hypothetical protein WBD37_07615 [Anderseniella sp.]